MKFLLNLLLPKKAGEIFSAAQRFLRGKKTYLAAGAMLLQSLAALAGQLCGLDGIAGLLEWLRGAAQNQTVLELAQSLAIMGLRAGIGAASAPPDSAAKAA
ncbi:MAG: hypothetical protein WC421_03550 [Elusimicrobiales bacterium]